jgi:hypothetical protein
MDLSAGWMRMGGVALEIESVSQPGGGAGRAMRVRGFRARC